MSTIIFPYKTVRDIDIRAKNVLVRVDFNVPLEKNGEIADDFRIISSLPTLKYLIENGAKIVLISHLGRPDGKIDAKFSLKKVAENLSQKLEKIYKELNLKPQKVEFVDDCIGEKVFARTKNMQNGEIILLENLRFHAAEEENSSEFAEKLARDSHAEIFVADGFGVVHRAHASTEAITHFLPSVAGFLLEKEFVELKSATENPNRPLFAILGGAKISDKIPLVKKFVEIADFVAVGGAMANNFLKFQGKNVAASLIENGEDEIISQILQDARAKFGPDFDEKFILPIDVAIAPHGNSDENRVEISLAGGENPLYGEAKIFDLGGKTIDKICEKIRASGTVIWNGDLGIDSVSQFSHASSRVALELAKNPQIISIIGGGDTSDFARNWDSLGGGSFTHVSTGGGASLELLAGENLPGISALMKK